MKKIKVQRKYIKRQSGYEIVPEIRISGKWLTQHGIEIGSHIHICLEPPMKAIKNPHLPKQIKIMNI